MWFGFEVRDYWLPNLFFFYFYNLIPAVYFKFPASFCQDVANERWDRVRVICSQPFNKERQFGLQFIDFVADDKQSSCENEKRLVSSPSQSLAEFRK